MGKSYTRELEHYLRANANTDFTGRQLADAVGCYATDPDGRRRYPNAGAPLRVIAEGCAPNASYPKGREPMQGLGYVREGKSWLSATFRYRAPSAAPTPVDLAQMERERVLQHIDEFHKHAEDMTELILMVSQMLPRLEEKLDGFADRLTALEKVWS